MRTWAWTIMASSMALTACVSPNGVSRNAVWMSPSRTATDEEQATQVAACQRVAATAPVYYTPSYVDYSSGATAMGGIIGAALARGVEQSQQRRAALENCLLSSGYFPLELSRTERRQMEALPAGPERAAFVNTIAEPRRAEIGAHQSETVRQVLISYGEPAYGVAHDLTSQRFFPGFQPEPVAATETAAPTPAATTPPPANAAGSPATAVTAPTPAPTQ